MQHEQYRYPVAILHLVGFLDLFAVSLIVPGFPVLIKSFGASPTLTGAITSIYGAVQLFTSPLVGKWSDEKGRYYVLSICLLASCIGYLISGFYVESLIALSLLRIVPGIFKHTQDLCRCSLIEESRGDAKNHVLGTFNAISSIGFIIGPTIYGHIIEYYGGKMGLLISYTACASFFLINLSVVSVIRLSPYLAAKKSAMSKVFTSNCNNHATSQNGSVRRSNSVQILSEMTDFQKGIFASRFFLALGVMMFRSSFVLWLTHYHPSIPSTTVGYILSYNGFLGLFFGFLVGTVSNLKYYSQNEEKLHLHATFLVIFSFAVLLISTRITMILIALTTLTMGTSILRVCGIVLTVKYLDNCNIGKYQGFGSSVISIARFAAPLVSGMLQEMSFSVPNVISLLLSVAGLFMFHRYSYLHTHQKLKKQ